MIKIILLGPPGAGKGTQAEQIIERFDIPRIATGDMLRDAVAQKTELGKRVQRYMDEGLLVDDETIIGLVKERLQQPDCSKGFLFDGFPRSVPQAQALHDGGIILDYVFELDVNDDVIVKRLSGRRIHPSSGRIYHVENNPPKVEGVDDITGEPLIIRDDDKEEVIRKRLTVYHGQTSPLVKFYKSLSQSNATKVIHLDGFAKPEVVSAQIIDIISGDSH